tara:strand:- start:359 stop:490 length:132 start_codon:yes stop_codon:yes gene_type:complete
MGVDHELQDYAEENVYVSDGSDETALTGGFMKKVEESIDIDEE